MLQHHQFLEVHWGSQLTLDINLYVVCFSLVLLLGITADVTCTNHSENNDGIFMLIIHQLWQCPQTSSFPTRVLNFCNQRCEYVFTTSHDIQFWKRITQKSYPVDFVKDNA